MKNVIFDLDGTLAICDQRTHYISGPDKNWDAFFDDCINDTVNEPVARLFRFYRDSPGHRVWIVSGRKGNDDIMYKTLEWLNNNDLLTTTSNVSHIMATRCSPLQMRQAGDLRSDVEVKLDIIRALGLTPDNTELVFDDRNCMVNAWRLWGFTCLQVAEGDF